MITVLDARPMSEVGFRGSVGSSSTSSTPSPSSIPKHQADFSNASAAFKEDGPMPTPSNDNIGGGRNIESGRGPHRVANPAPVALRVSPAAGSVRRPGISLFLSVLFSLCL